MGQNFTACPVVEQAQADIGICHAWLVGAGCWLGGTGGTRRCRGHWEVQGALGHCPVPHTVNLQPSSPELCSHPSGVMSHLQPRLASNAREQIPNSQRTAFPWRFPLLILMSKRGVNKLAKQKEGQQPSHIPLCWFAVHLSSVPPLGSVLVGLTSAVHI